MVEFEEGEGKCAGVTTSVGFRVTTAPPTGNSRETIELRKGRGLSGTTKYMRHNHTQRTTHEGSNRTGTKEEEEK